MLDDNYYDYDEHQAHDDAPPEEIIGAIVASTLRYHAEWLQKEPRTEQEITAHLFHKWDGLPIDQIDFFLLITYCLWDQGYTTAARSDGKIEWRWMEGKGPFLGPLLWRDNSLCGG